VPRRLPIESGKSARRPMGRSEHLVRRSWMKPDLIERARGCNRAVGSGVEDRFVAGELCVVEGGKWGSGPEFERLRNESV
jgi:hypothetical protein